jgi:F-type H+-transporting ATPase subunit c
MIRKNVVAISAFFSTFLVSVAAFAEDGRALSGADAGALLGAGLCIAIAAFGGSLGQGKAAAAALEGISRNPTASGKIFTPMILGLALIESLVIYALLIAFTITGKV